MIKHETKLEHKLHMQDDVFHTLRYYRDNDFKGNGIIGIPLTVKLKHVNHCVKYGWMSEKPVGIGSIYKVTEIGLKAMQEKEEYLDQKLKADHKLRHPFDHSLNNKSRVLRHRTKLKLQKLKC